MSMPWKTKALIQRLLHYLPGGHIAYHTGQKYVGSLRTVKIHSKMQQAFRLVSCLTELENLDVLKGKQGIEIGTGWIPVIPILFWALGLKTSDTFDIERLLLPKHLIQAAHQFVQLPLSYQPFITEEASKEVQAKVASLAQFLTTQPTAQELLEYCCIRYHAPYDAAMTSLPDASVDFVFSNTVLEHVDQAGIHRLFTEMRRVLRPGGYMLHLIDLSDHFSHQDKTITSINFLQFSDKEFARYNTRFLFQNRLRASQWQHIFASHGFEIRHCQANIDQRAIPALPMLSLDANFQNLSVHDICTSSICVLAALTK